MDRSTALNKIMQAIKTKTPHFTYVRSGRCSSAVSDMDIEPLIPYQYRPTYHPEVPPWPGGWRDGSAFYHPPHPKSEAHYTIEVRARPGKGTIHDTLDKVYHLEDLIPVWSGNFYRHNSLELYFYTENPENYDGIGGIGDLSEFKDIPEPDDFGIYRIPEEGERTKSCRK